MAFISRHEPSSDQLALAADMGYELVHIGDVDGFNTSIEDIHEKLISVIGETKADLCETYCVVHAGLAAFLSWQGYSVAVFENKIRIDFGAPAEYHPVKLHVFANYY